MARKDYYGQNLTSAKSPFDQLFHSIYTNHNSYLSPVDLRPSTEERKTTGQENSSPPSFNRLRNTQVLRFVSCIYMSREKLIFLA